VTTSAHKKGILYTSDIILILFIIIGILLEYISPSSFSVPAEIYITVGFLVLLVGWAIILSAKLYLKKYLQPSKPGLPTTTLITTGIFSFSRNPIYLGVVIIPIGLGFLIDSLWVSLSVIPIWLFIHLVLIIPEEEYLLSNFVGEFLRYKEKVPRWL